MDNITPTTETASQTAGHSGSAKRRTLAGITAAAVAGAALCGVAVFAFGGSTAHAASGGSSSSQGHSGNHSGSNSGSNSGNHSGNHSGGSHAKPSASVKELQKQLGQLNYYEGPVDGFDGPQTVAAIKDLQRDAHLPQTGVMNTATSNALKAMLAHGNNVMNQNN